MSDQHLETDGLRVTLLGSGSPSPNLNRCHPAVLVEWGASGRALVDAGDGVVAQLLRNDTPLAVVDLVLLTHMHWDHILGYPAFVWGSWSAGRNRLRTIGPAGTTDMHDRLVSSFYTEQAEWAIDLGYDRDGWFDVRVQDVEPGWSAVVQECTISAGAVVHPPMAAVSYRFDYQGRSVVISGDTAACEELVEFSTDADMLVVDACAADPPPGAPPKRAALIERLRTFHASPGQCIEMAERASVGHVVLTHHLPEAVPDVEPGSYGGQISVGADLETFIV